MSVGYRASHLQVNKGLSYHAAFEQNPYRSMVWRFEQEVLDRIMRVFYKNGMIYHLDFACGTGRILSCLEQRTRCSVGVDVSPSMLQVARKNAKVSELIEADLTQSDVLGNRKFNLITAFRFFPNAENGLRSEAMQVLSKHLADDGYLVFNNHRNTNSTRNRLARLLGRKGFRGMNGTEVKNLLAENDLEIVKTYPLCVFPASEKHTLLPLFMLRSVDTFLGKWCPMKSLGENLIFVCRRSVNSFGEKE